MQNYIDNYTKVDYINTTTQEMNVSQSKTSENVSTPLNNIAIEVLGEVGLPSKTVFTLLTANGANKTLKAWVKRAGISKAIT